MPDGCLPLLRARLAHGRAFSRRTVFRVLLAALLVLALPVALRAFEVPGELGPNNGKTADTTLLPDLHTSKIAPVADGFKPAEIVKIKVALPDEPLVPGQVYTAAVTWTAPPKHHLNGRAEEPAISHIELRLIGDAFETAAPGFTGTLQAPEFEGLAPYFHEARVTGSLQFRVKRGLPPGTALHGLLEIDSSFCSEAGLCYEYVCTKKSGQRYTVDFAAAPAEAAADAPFEAPRQPPITSKGGTPPVEPNGIPSPPPAAPATAPSAYKVTALTPVEGQFKEPKDAQIRVDLPDQPLTVGKLYTAQVTWTVTEKFHVNGIMASDPTSPASRFTLTGPGLETGTLTYNGHLLPNPIEGATPYFAEKTVTASLPFRLLPVPNEPASSASPAGGASPAAPVARPAVTLQIDTSYCAEAGKCYYYTSEMKKGQSYTVVFKTAGEAVTPEPFPAPAATPPVSANPAAPTTAPTAGADAPEPDGWYAIIASDLPMPAKVQLLYKHGGLGLIFFFVLAFGVITTGLPCTYPLIPITSRILGAPVPGKTPQPGDPTRGDAFAASLFYMFGLTMVYGVLGGTAAVVGKTGSAWITNLNNHAWFNDGIAILFVILALAMYGWFEIKMPLFITNKFQRAAGGPGSARGPGMVGNALRGLSMGALAALLAGACTAPIVIAAILLITKLGPEVSFVRGFLILAPFGLGFGIPYFLLTNFISKLPAPGQWMELLKIVFGTVILLFAFYFWNNTQPNPTAFALLLGTTLLAVGIGFGALDRREAPVPMTDRVQQVLTVGTAVAGGLFLVIGLRHATGMEAPAAPAGPATALTVSAVSWESHDSYDPETPDTSGRPVFIFFHSPSCQYCKKMLAEGFRDPAVVALTQKVRMIDADAVHPDDPKLLVLQKKYEFFAQPTCVFLNAQQQPAFGDNSVEPGYLTTEQLKARFEKLLKP